MIYAKNYTLKLFKNGKLIRNKRLQRMYLIRQLAEEWNRDILKRGSKDYYYIEIAPDVLQVDEDKEYADIDIRDLVHS